MDGEGGEPFAAGLGRGEPEEGIVRDPAGEDSCSEGCGGAGVAEASPLLALPKPLTVTSLIRSQVILQRKKEKKKGTKRQCYVRI